MTLESPFIVLASKAVIASLLPSSKVRIWSLTSHDPDPDFAFFNDLETVQSQEIFWLCLRAPQDFLGRTHPAGWSLVALP